MICLVCNKFSLKIICKKCQKEFLTPKIKQKDDVISFYNYEDIEFLLKYKYHLFGSRVFEILAQNSFREFSKVYKQKIYSISIDDRVKKGYSHTAILNNSLKSPFITPLYKKLLSQNNISYAGKSLEFRKHNPRDFVYNGKENIDVILVDDVVTTKTTLNQAKEVLERHNVNVLFSCVLVDKRW